MINSAVHYIFMTSVCITFIIFGIVIQNQKSEISDLKTYQHQEPINISMNSPSQKNSETPPPSVKKIASMIEESQEIVGSITSISGATITLKTYLVDTEAMKTMKPEEVYMVPRIEKSYQVNVLPSTRSDKKIEDMSIGDYIRVHGDEELNTVESFDAISIEYIETREIILK